MVSQVARCTKIINPNTDDAKYMINVKQIAKFVVGLGDRVAPADIEEGMRVGVDRNKYQIQIPLPPKIDPTVTMMTVEEKPDITYNDIGGNKEEIQKLREVLELPMLHPERFVQLGIDPMHFGLVMVLNLMIGLLTPPVGLVLFILARISQMSIERTIVAILPWFAPLLISLLIITYVPQVVLWLPNLMR